MLAHTCVRNFGLVRMKRAHVHAIRGCSLELTHSVHDTFFPKSRVRRRGAHALTAASQHVCQSPCAVRFAAPFPSVAAMAFAALANTSYLQLVYFLNSLSVR